MHDNESCSPVEEWYPGHPGSCFSKHIVSVSTTAASWLVAPKIEKNMKMGYSTALMWFALFDLPLDVLAGWLMGSASIPLIFIITSNVPILELYM